MKYEHVNCSVQIIDSETVSMQEVIYNSDCYITNRESENLKMVEIANFYSKRILSGVDISIWN